jgi:hypothetical protein
LKSLVPFFFERQGLCYLHVELQGNIKHHTSVVLRTLTQGQIAGMLKF